VQTSCDSIYHSVGFTVNVQPNMYPSIPFTFPKRIVNTNKHAFNPQFHLSCHTKYEQCVKTCTIHGTYKITDKNIFAMLTYKFFLHPKFAYADMDFKQQDMNKPPQETVDTFLAKTEVLCHQTYTFIHMTHSCLVSYQHCSDTVIRHTSTPSTLSTT